MKTSRLKKLETKAGMNIASPEVLYFRTVYENRDGSDGKIGILAIVAGETPDQCFWMKNEEGEDIEELEKRVKANIERIIKNG